MLLNTLIKHESAISCSLEDYIKKALNKILNTYFQFDHEHSIKELFATQFDAVQINTDDVEIMATAFDNDFGHLYAEMQEALDCELVKSLFENFYHHMMEEKNIFPSTFI